MPKWLHDQLARRADKLARQGKLRSRGGYIYGTMDRIEKLRRAKRKARRRLRDG